MITIHQRYRQTDRQTTCDRNTALCTKVHRAVKMVREPGVEPGSIAWKATMLPLYHSRSCLAYFFYLIYTSRNITHDILQPGVTLRGDEATRCVDCGFVRLRTKIRTYSA